MIRVPTHAPPTHPGEFLLEEFLKPAGVTQTALARELDVSYPTVNDIVNRKRAVTFAMAQKLARYCGTTTEFWMTMQLRWDLFHEEDTPELKKIEPLQVSRAAG